VFARISMLVYKCVFMSPEAEETQSSLHISNRCSGINSLLFPTAFPLHALIFLFRRPYKPATKNISLYYAVSKEQATY
jgi:hypothetical protein